MTFYDFEDGLIPLHIINDAGYPWTVTDADAIGGINSFTSGNGSFHNTSSEFSITEDFNAGEISFWYRVSSEESFDKFWFYIDDVVMINGISGDNDWNLYSSVLTAGNHTLRWVYTKDGSDSTFEDAVFIDEITIPVDYIGSILLNDSIITLVSDQFDIGENVSYVVPTKRRKTAPWSYFDKYKDVTKPKEPPKYAILDITAENVTSICSDVVDVEVKFELNNPIFNDLVKYQWEVLLNEGAPVDDILNPNSAIATIVMSTINQDDVRIRIYLDKGTDTETYADMWLYRTPTDTIHNLGRTIDDLSLKGYYDVENNKSIDTYLDPTNISVGYASYNNDGDIIPTYLHADATFKSFQWDAPLLDDLAVNRPHLKRLGSYLYEVGNNIPVASNMNPHINSINFPIDSTKRYFIGLVYETNLGDKVKVEINAPRSYQITAFSSIPERNARTGVAIVDNLGLISGRTVNDMAGTHVSISKTDLNVLRYNETFTKGKRVNDIAYKVNVIKIQGIILKNYTEEFNSGKHINEISINSYTITRVNGISVGG